MKALEFVRNHPVKIGLFLILAALLAYLLIHHRDDLTRESLIRYGRSLPAGLFILAFFALPLIGAPISIFLVLVGIRFGFAWGVALAAAAILFHHGIAFLISHTLFKGRLKRWIEGRGHSIPVIQPENRIWLTAVFAAVHGPPYFLKLYSLALTDIPFRIYLTVGAPVYLLFALVPVGAGSAAVHVDVTWLYVAIGGLSLSYPLIRYLRKRKAKAAGGR